MATIREGDRKVLLVVDAQIGVMRNLWNEQSVIKNIDIAVDKARNHSVPVIWVQHSDEEHIYESPDWELIAALEPKFEETRINKHFNSSFEQTTLEKTLANLGATHLFLAGAATNWCIRATAYAALDRGYDLTLISDAHTTESINLKNDILIEAESIVQELNIVADWLSYPGCTSRSLSANEIDFSTP